MKLISKLIILLVLLATLVFGAVFTALNNQVIEIDLVFRSLEGQKIGLWVIFSFATGLLVGLLIAAMHHVRMKAVVSRLRKEIDAGVTKATPLPASGKSLQRR